MSARISRLPLREIPNTIRHSRLYRGRNAHIIHHDLKPANIKLTPSGVVKILDFGLAKSASQRRPGPNLTMSPTLSSEMTRAGMILGTAVVLNWQATLKK